MGEGKRHQSTGASENPCLLPEPIIIFVHPDDSSPGCSIPVFQVSVVRRCGLSVTET